MVTCRPNRTCISRFARSSVSSPTWKSRPIPRPMNTCPRSITTICSTARRRSPFSPASAHNRRVMIQGYHGTGQIDPYRTGRRAPQLAVPADQPGQPHQPYRPGRQGRHRRARRQAGDRVPRRPSCRGRCRPTRPWCSTSTMPAAPTSCSSSSACSRSPASSPCSIRTGSSSRTRHSACSRTPTPSVSATPPGSITAPSRSTRARWTGGGIVTTLNYLSHEAESKIVLAKAKTYDTDDRREIVGNMVRVAELTRSAFHERRSVDRHEPAHGGSPGPRMPRSSTMSVSPSGSPSSTSATSWNARSWPSSTSAASTRNCRSRRRTPR